MNSIEFLRALRGAPTVAEARSAIDAFVASHRETATWVAVGRENNRGTIEGSADPGRSLVERLTNGIDAVLEGEHELHSGRPECRSPREAALAWLNVPPGGLSQMTPAQRRQLAQRVSIKLELGGGRESRVVTVRDLGVGIEPTQMSETILSLNTGNKMTKHYLAGAYGQGGSSTFAVSTYTLIASRRAGQATVGFSVVRFDDLPPDLFKIGHYVYLVDRGSILEAELPLEEFAAGTEARHFGYDLTKYGSPVGPASVYGLLGQVLFDPVMPVWLDNAIHNYRRVIKGARNALNGAIDEGDNRDESSLSYNNPMFYVTLGDYGQIGIEYWVLNQTENNKKPSQAFINPSRPIVMTVNGQNQAELSQILIRKNAELPYLTQRLICHINCDSLTPLAKRSLFVSNREDARRGAVYELIEQEVIRALKSDDDLVKLNKEAKEQGLRERDESARQQMRNEVARLLRVHGLELTEALAGGAGTTDGSHGRLAHPRQPRPTPTPIPTNDPPTFVRILWEEGEPITFYAGQRRYIRIETDAPGAYHNPNNPAASRLNIIVSGGSVRVAGSTPLHDGRMRIVLEGLAGATLGATGQLKVEIARQGLEALSAERQVEVVAEPVTRRPEHRATLPPFEVRPVEGPSDPRWSVLDWPEDLNKVAAEFFEEEGQLVIWYSTVFPKYTSEKANLEQRDIALAATFTTRYELWLAVHALLMYEDQRQAEAASDSVPISAVDQDDAAQLRRDRKELCRGAVLATLHAAREAREPIPAEAVVD